MTCHQANSKAAQKQGEEGVHLLRHAASCTPPWRHQYLAHVERHTKQLQFHTCICIYMYVHIVAYKNGSDQPYLDALQRHIQSKSNIYIYIRVL